MQNKTKKKTLPENNESNRRKNNNQERFILQLKIVNKPSSENAITTCFANNDGHFLGLGHF